MKYTIREVKEEEEAAPGLELYLHQNNDGSIDLRGKSPNGVIWSILCLRTDGAFSRTSFIASGIGLQVNGEGRIIEHEDSGGE